MVPHNPVRPTIDPRRFDTTITKCADTGDISVTGRSVEVLSRVERAWSLTHRYARLLQASRESSSSQLLDAEAHQWALVDVAVPDFCDWSCVDDIGFDGRLVQVALRHVDCMSHFDERHDDQCAALGVRDKYWRGAVERALESGVSGVHVSKLENGGHCVIVPLWVAGNALGVVTFAFLDADYEPGDAELAAAEQMCWSLGNLLERQHLTGVSREAARQTQRIARQLHQLIAASITVAGMSTERDILRSLAGSTRSVFDGDFAVVRLDAEGTGSTFGVARRGMVASVESADSDVVADAPSVRPGAREPWLDGRWLVAPISERPIRSHGLVAVRRPESMGFGPEDREVLTLLGQLASSALGANDLARSIERSEERLRTLIDTAPIGIVEVAVNGVVRYWNPAAGHILAWGSHDPDAAVPEFPDDARTELRGLWGEVLAGETVSGRDFEGVDIAGRARILSVSAAPLVSSVDGASGILVLVDDVTSHRELMAELRHAHTMEVRGQVASRIAHDFNNLLTLISGYAEILLRELDEDDRRRRMVTDIMGTASRASLLTSQLQTIGRTKVAKPVVVDPTAVMQSNAEVLERILGATVELQWLLDESAEHVRVDPDQFEQMILNLVINARDAMPDGGRLCFRVQGVSLGESGAVRHALAPGRYVQLSVIDNGIGMDEATLERCFEPLFTSKGPFKGTGMGLASARRLVEESGGVIWCRSTPGEGTTFDILLPAIAGPVTESALNVDVVRVRGDASVLVVEDDDGLRRLMGQVLQRNGYEVTAVESAERALEVAQSLAAPVDLLLSDVVMGGMNGRDLAVQLQAHWPELRVLLVSGTANSSITKGLVEESSDFLAKPFKPSQLIDRVHELLARHR